ncbi:hypothetical protein [Flavihumibacter sp. CACIAM 22H1]|uniref:hypothetical protein n=1 Tax=Flavihumibacter sp. CACIAM 22H1 TaxID=1812911 RepID=UPI0025BA3317|nr:hypothetical protein [Flavihumibacter sp. CACIAM 22H1]
MTVLIGLAGVQAQEVRVTASINRNKILIGEPILLTLNVEIPQATRMGWFDLDTIPHFQFITRNKIDTQNNARTVLFRQVLSITSFDSGSWVIPQLGLTVGNNRYLTDSIPVMVDYSPTDPNQPYHDLKDIVELPAVDTLYINYILAAVTLIAIALLVYFLWGRNKAVEVKEKPSAIQLSALEQALKELAELKAAGQPSATEVKPYFTRLNDITRNYFKNRGLVTAPDASNEVLVMRVQSDLSREQLYQLAQTLRLADAVKFARYIPPVNEQEEAVDMIRKSLSIIEEVHYKKPGA